MAVGAALHINNAAINHNNIIVIIIAVLPKGKP
jgi:hypothetical protein